MWVWDEIEMLGKPDNVLLTKWAPQQDILAHPNLKVFVTHAGQSSFQEALCHKKVRKLFKSKLCIKPGPSNVLPLYCRTIVQLIATFF